jgi:hypothetical protein
MVASMFYLVPGSPIPFVASAIIYALAFPLTYALKEKPSRD